MEKNKTILITGGCGYIGSHTVVELVKAGYTPIIVDDFRNANRVVVAGLTEIIGFAPPIHEIDVCDVVLMETLFQHYSFSGIKVIPDVNKFPSGEMNTSKELSSKPIPTTEGAV